MNKNRILVTGSTGFLGIHTMKVLKGFKDYEIIGVSQKDYNLLREEDVKKMFSEIQPDYLVHLAARSGGIYSNRIEPADYYYKNITLITNTFHYAAINEVKRILVPIGGCSYPATAESPIREEVMWDGFAQTQSAGYSMAKKMALVQSWAYQQQYGTDSTIIIPGNMYGEHDNFSLTDSHVIPAMIRKLYEAKASNKGSLSFWGSGNPQRDFVYAGDVAKLIPYFLFKFNGSSPINISSGTSISMKELVRIIASKIDYSGKILWDSSQPDGQMIKLFSVEKMKMLGLSCDTPLDKGLDTTINWFIENYQNKCIRL